MSAPGDRFERDGFVVVRRLLGDDGVAALRDLGDRLLRDGVEPSRQVLYVGSDPPPSRPGLDALMRQWFAAWGRLPLSDGDPMLARVVDAVRAATGEPMVPFQDTLLHKLPTHAEFPWHQDAPFWPVDADHGAVCWVALDDVDSVNGAISVVIGSHQTTTWPAIDLHTGQPQNGAAAPLLDGELVTPGLTAGDAVIFHSRCVHRSGENRTSVARRAWASSWLPVSARWCFDRVPRHPVRSQVNDGEEVQAWSRSRYRLAPG